MVRRESLHIGLNAVDPRQYDGWDGKLRACENDAQDMWSKCCVNYNAKTTLLTKDATSSKVRSEVLSRARRLVSGDRFVISYSGHGGQVPDKNRDEADYWDETWCLWDRQVIDDELYSWLATFRAGVRILVLSDSCHSGTMTRGPMPVHSIPFKTRWRAMPKTDNIRDYDNRKRKYDSIQYRTKHKSKTKGSVKASVVLISGCQDNQYSEDGEKNGLFTEKLLKVWNDGKFTGSLKRLHRDIVSLMPPWQTPNYYRVGIYNSAFENAKPFA